MNNPNSSPIPDPDISAPVMGHGGSILIGETSVQIRQWGVGPDLRRGPRHLKSVAVEFAPENLDEAMIFDAAGMVCPCVFLIDGVAAFEGKFLIRKTHKRRGGGSFPYRMSGESYGEIVGTEVDRAEALDASKIRKAKATETRS